MLNSVKEFLKGLIYENGVPSRTGITSILFTLAFLAGTAYLMLKGIKWDHYDTFAIFTTGGGAATVLGNKLINSKLNSVDGKFPEK